MPYSVNDDDRCEGCGGKVPKIGTPRYDQSPRKRGCEQRKARVANHEIDVCGAFNPFLSDGETRYQRYVGSKCHDPRHENPCPLPCVACDDECEGPYVRYFDVTYIEIINRDLSTTRRLSPSLVLAEGDIDEMKDRIDSKLASLREIRAGLENITDGPRVHEIGQVAREVEWAHPWAIESRLVTKACADEELPDTDRWTDKMRQMLSALATDWPDMKAAVLATIDMVPDTHREHLVQSAYGLYVNGGPRTWTRLDCLRYLLDCYDDKR